MMKEQLKKFEYLWDGTAPQWVLMNLGSNSNSPEYLVMNIESKSAMIIEDDALADLVIEKMLAAGVRVMAVGQAS